MVWQSPMLLRPPFVALAVAQASCGAPAPSSPAPSPRASVHIPAPVAAPPLPASSTPPSPDRPHLEVVVPSTNCEWTTASTFEAGQLLHIQARGTWQVCREHCVAALQNQPVGPQGFAAHPTTVDDPVADSTGTMTVGGFLVSNVARGALLGQLGDQAAFAVGPSWTVKLTEASPLAFSINDNDCRDNRGTMTVRITAYDDPAELRLSLAERQRVLQRAITLGQAIDEQAVAGSPYFSLQYYLSSQPDLAEARTAAGIRLTFLHAIHGGTPSWDLTLDSQGTIQGRSTSGYDDLARQLGLDPSGQPLPPE